MNNPARPSLQGVVLATLSTALAAFAIGALTSLVSNLVYLVILFPVAMGMAAARTTAEVVKANKIRVPLWGMAFGIFAGSVIYGTFHYVNFLTFQSQASEVLRQQLVAAYGQAYTGDPGQAVDVILQRETGYSGFAGYILFQAKEGVSIGHLLGGDYASIGTFFTWVYWLVELVIIAGLAFSRGAQAASEPFCDVHNRWYEKEQHLGGVEASKIPGLWNLIKQRDFAHLGATLEEDASMPSIEVYIQSCDNCNASNTWFTLKHARFEGRGGVQFQNALRGTITPSQRRDLVSNISWFKE